MAINDLFDLDPLKEAKEDVLDLNVNESSDDEFAYKCPSNHPEEHFDADNSGNKEQPVPGGDKEKPNAKPADGEFGPTPPGGDTERPTAKPADGEFGPTLNLNDEILDSETYNNAIDQLKSSFKEAYGILDMISKAQVVTESVEEKQERYNLEVLEEAYMSGPIYESVDRSDKEAVKKATVAIKKNIKQACNDLGLKFRESKLLLNAVGGVALSAAAPFITGLSGATITGKAIGTAISNRLWQIIGTVYVEEGNADEVGKKLTEKFKSELGDYKILPVKMQPDVVDLFKGKLAWKNNKGVYLLVVDKKLPDEIKNAVSSKRAKSEEK